MLHRSIVCLISTLAVWAGPVRAQEVPVPQAVRVYVGTSTSAGGEGIYQLRLDLQTGALSTEAPPTRADNPSWLDLHPTLPVLYSVNETGSGNQDGTVSSFRIDPRTGVLTPMNQQSSAGAGPTYLSLDRDARNLLVANFNGGSVAVLPLAEDGWLNAATSVRAQQGSGPLPLQNSAHAHAIDVDAGNRFALEPDLGIDRLLVFRFDAERGQLTPNDPESVSLPPGSGPRHLDFSPDGRRVYLVNELSSKVTVYDFDADAGRLLERQTISTLPAAFQGQNSAAEIAVRRDGRFVYASNRGADSIAIFRVDPVTGLLSSAGHESTRGSTPRHFALDPTGRFLLAANQNSNTIAVFRVDAESGSLTPLDPLFSVPQPQHLRMTPIAPAP